MALEPTDIEQKTFSTALRGYDLDEVDDFLDQVVTTLRELHEKLESAERSDPAPGLTEADETAVGRALIKAQETSDQIIADARADADRIRSEAQSEADAWMGERERKKAEAEAELVELSREVGEVRAKLAALATTVADKLDEMDQAIEQVQVPEETQQPDYADEDDTPEAAHSGADQDRSF